MAPTLMYCQIPPSNYLETSRPGWLLVDRHLGLPRVSTALAHDANSLLLGAVKLDPEHRLG